MSGDFDNHPFVLYKGQRFTIVQREEFRFWLSTLRDRAARARIASRVRRLADGNPGDVKSVGDGVYELRLFFGPGYRVYYMYRGDEVILLLAGGDKGSQERDVATAKRTAEAGRDGTEDDDL